jgi:thiol:disulfide interchange protein DsbC
MKKLLIIASLGLAALSATAQAASACGSAGDYGWLADALNNSPEKPAEAVAVNRVVAAEHLDLCELKLNTGTLLYTKPGSRSIMLGRVFAVESDAIVDMTQVRIDADTREMLGTISTSDYIAFSPASAPKASIYVMTDVDCHFCQQLHKEIPELNKAGIEVRYLPYVRGGKQGSAWNAMSNAWCATDRKAVFGQAISGATLPAGNCDSQALEKFQGFARQVQLQGTPHILLADGTSISGYRPADLLIKLALD